MSDHQNHYTYRARCERVIDGDTIEVFIDQGFEDYTIKTLRIKGIDTAEIYGVPKESDSYELGHEQKRFVESFTKVDSDSEFPLSVRTFGTGKYGRWIAYVSKDGEKLSDALMEEWPEVENW